MVPRENKASRVTPGHPDLSDRRGVLVCPEKTAYLDFLVTEEK